MRVMLHARVEEIIDGVNLDYQGSITLPEKVMEENDIWEGEQVHVLNRDNGERFITYAIPGENVCLNGAAARKGIVGDEIIILTYRLV
jgi:aspartate 1-decarboxylase